MKINPLFHSLSISKVISSVAILAFIIAGAHLFTFLITNHNQSNNEQAINNLRKLKNNIDYVINTENVDRDSLYFSLNKYSPKYENELLTNKFFDVEHIRIANTELQLAIIRIQQKIKQASPEKLIFLLTSLSEATQFTISQYQILLKKESFVIFISQISTFVLIVSLSLFLFIYCRRHIVAPLNKLEENVSSISSHHFNVEFIENKNEIGVLSTGLKSMSAELESLIGAMQQKVFQKNIELINANETIQFLFDISQKLNTVKLTHSIIIEALNALAKQTNLSHLSLELVNGVKINSVYGCALKNKKHKIIPIIINGEPYGYLNYTQVVATAESASIITSFSSLLARALYQEEYSLQEQKLLLIEERGVIARELHDSIAQALSFLKIQCTVLNRQINAGDCANNQDVRDSVTNIEEAVGDAYVQLRSLLSTFRLNISISDFKEAVLVMVSQLQKQTTAKIKLGEFESNLQTHANQHVHLLQIIREAIVNAMKHANCSSIVISCAIINKEVVISITDDGIGISNTPGKQNHYGIEIMNQRAAELNAELEINKLETGTQIKLIFEL